VAAVHELKEIVGIPARLRDIGVREDALPEIAHKTMTITRLTRMNPRRVSEGDLLAIVQNAF
jgi:alcohol dehydrogenase class IV